MHRLQLYPNIWDREDEMAVELRARETISSCSVGRGLTQAGKKV
jgi:hypothetical protein